MKRKEKVTIDLIVQQVLEELKVMGDSAVNGYFKDYGAHEANIKNLLILLKYV